MLSRDDRAATVGALCDRYPEFAQGLQAALGHVASDPQIALSKLRIILEAVVGRTYDNFAADSTIKRTRLADQLAELDFARAVPDAVLAAMDALRRSGNQAAHGGVVTVRDAAIGVDQIVNILEWSSQWWPPPSRGRLSKLMSSGTVTRVGDQPEHRNAVPTDVLIEQLFVTSLAALFWIPVIALGLGGALMVIAFVLFRVPFDNPLPMVSGAILGLVVAAFQIRKIFREGIRDELARRRRPPAT